MAKKLKVWNGASWEDVTFAITPPSTNVTNEFTTNQVIDVSTSAAALRITQRGAGEALRVEDETNPDSTSFVINNAGLVGIGTASPDSALHIVSSGDPTINITKTGQSTWYLQGLNSGVFRIYSGTANVERLRISADGNIGIGNQGPVYALDVSRSEPAITTGSTTLFMRFISSGGNSDMLQFYAERTSNVGLAWTTEDLIIRRFVDATPMSSIRWPGGEQNPITVLTAPNSRAIRTTHISTGTPSGGNDGDVWMVYT